MSELGQLLRKARLEKGISLEDLQESTKIRKRYLECIEEGNFNALPGSFYVRAFIKSYAEAVGLDPNEVLQLYRNVLPETVPEPAAESRSPQRTINKRSDRWSRLATGVMLASFFLLIVGLIYYFAYQNYGGGIGRTITEDQGPLTEKLAADTPTPAATPGDAGVEPKAIETPKPITPEVKFIKSEGSIDYYEVYNVDKLQVELTLTGTDCWFQIDGLNRSGDRYTREMIQQGSLAKLGSPKSWESDKPVYLNLGFPKAVELKVNGVPVPLGSLSNPKRLQFVAVQSPA